MKSAKIRFSAMAAALSVLGMSLTGCGSSASGTIFVIT